MSRLFTNEDTWTGGYYELAIEVGPTADAPLLAALKTVWTHPSLEGCYLDPDKEPDEQPQVQVAPEMLSGMRIQGVAHLPNGSRTACGTHLVREEDGGPDWLVFYLPMGALGEAYDVGGYPFDETERNPESWQKPIDEWLAEMSRYVYSRSPFRLALIGHEVSGEAYASQIEKDGMPEKRLWGYVWPQEGQVEYFPKNVWG